MKKILMAVVLFGAAGMSMQVEGMYGRDQNEIKDGDLWSHLLAPYFYPKFTGDPTIKRKIEGLVGCRDWGKRLGVDGLIKHINDEIGKEHISNKKERIPAGTFILNGSQDRA